MNEFYIADPTPVRECGQRKEGGIYVEFGLSVGGAPLEHFLLDPPIPTSQLTLISSTDTVIRKLNPRGMTVARLCEHGPYHLFDWVGMDNYPNVADFVEEVRLHGLSRRVPKTAQFDLLDKRSRIIIVHARGYVHNFADYYDAVQLRNPKRKWDAIWRCPRGRFEHLHQVPDEMCSGIWWLDLDPRAQVAPYPRVGKHGFPLVERKMTHMAYYVALRPAGISPVYEPAVAASFPIWRLAVVKAEDGSHETSRAAAERSRLPVVEVER